jgi:hypothetical protein
MGTKNAEEDEEADMKKSLSEGQVTELVLR